MSKYREIGEKVIKLTEEKDPAYGHSVATAGEVLKLFYPDGIKPEQYRDAAAMVRVIDKLKRIATKKNAFGESPWLDIMGYGLVVAVAEGKGPENTCRNCKSFQVFHNTGVQQKECQGCAWQSNWTPEEDI